VPSPDFIGNTTILSEARFLFVVGVRGSGLGGNLKTVPSDKVTEKCADPLLSLGRGFTVPAWMGADAGLASITYLPANDHRGRLNELLLLRYDEKALICDIRASEHYFYPLRKRVI
jgi:hypothetical protein